MTEVGDRELANRSQGAISGTLPLFSVCLHTLNARRFLKPRMDSVFEQTCSNWELIVYDSYSDDGTWEYLQQFKDDSRVRLVSGSEGRPVCGVE